MLKKLNYVFAVSFLSSKDDGSWTQVRFRVLQSNECKNSAYVLAGNIAAHHLKPEERGVRVEYLGLQEDQTKSGKKPQNPEAPITPMCCFTLEIRKENKL